ncbi:hypothetical protein U1Q18_036984 [Sarracenia purpurea var. burkii]
MVLKSKLRGESKKFKMKMADTAKNLSTTTSFNQTQLPNSSGLTLEIGVKIVGLNVVQSENVNYPATRLMDALRDLELPVHHANTSRVNDLMLQHVVVRAIPGRFTSEGGLKVALNTLR